MKGYYLDLPLLLGLKFNLSNDMSIIPKAGGYISYGLSGTLYFEGKDEQGEPFSGEHDLYTSSFSFGTVGDPRQLRYPDVRFGAGMQAGLDIMWKQYAVRGTYKFGLTEHTMFAQHVSDRSFSIAVAYYFLNK